MRAYKETVKKIEEIMTFLDCLEAYSKGERDVPFTADPPEEWKDVITDAFEYYRKDLEKEVHLGHFMR